MDGSQRPWRSVLYIPGARERALEKAQSLAADAIIFDLEDAVAPDEKSVARETLYKALADGGYGRRARLIRVNGLETQWGEADLRMATTAACDGVVVPKVDGPVTLDAIAPLAPDRPLWAMMETPLGVVNAPSIAHHERLQGFIMGTNDLAKDLGSRARPDRLPLQMALQTCLLAARAAGKICVDGVYNAFKDEDGLRLECEQGRELGMDGKTLIHPAQIAIANVTFGPSEAELELARRQIEAFEQAVQQGEGVAVLDGRIVENLHVETAQALLAKARMIADMEDA